MQFLSKLLIFKIFFLLFLGGYGTFSPSRQYRDIFYSLTADLVVETDPSGKVHNDLLKRVAHWQTQQKILSVPRRDVLKEIKRQPASSIDSKAQKNIKIQTKSEQVKSIENKVLNILKK